MKGILATDVILSAHPHYDIGAHQGLEEALKDIVGEEALVVFPVVQILILTADIEAKAAAIAQLEVLVLQTSTLC